MTKTISLASLFPGDFAQFQRTGRLNFYTPMELFERDFPSHYLRIIRQVRISVIALVPPNEGIKAQMTNIGNSYTTTYNNSIERRVQVSRDPEVISLSAPMNSNGLFELQTDNDMLLPFEGLGVETSWEFVMNKASNPIDFNTIADVLITIDYTAMNNGLLGETIGKRLDGAPYEAERVFSLKNQFADAWFDLHNPDQVADDNRHKAKLTIDRSDFPSHLRNVNINAISLFVIAEDEEAQIGSESTENSSLASGKLMNLSAESSDGSAGSITAEVTLNSYGVASSRAGNLNENSSYNLYSTDGNLGSLIESTNVDSPTTFIVELPNDTGDGLRELIAADKVDDILLILTYSGDAPTYALEA